MDNFFDNFVFNPDDCTDDEYSPIPEGDYRIRIDNVEPKTSKNGNSMFEFEFAVSGDNRKLWYYMVFTGDVKAFNEKLGRFFRSFEITDHDLKHYHDWPGKVGACRIKHRENEWNGEKTIKAEVHYFINGDRKDKLPPWVEPANGLMQGAPAEIGGVTGTTVDTPW